MALARKIDSGVVGLRYAEETSTPGVLPGSPVWHPLDPNSYGDFGSTIQTIVRKPISQSRQNKKGVVTDVDAAASISIDLTQENLQRLLQGFFFAAFRKKYEKEDITSATVQAGNDTYETNNTTGLFVGTIIKATGFTNSQNNGIKNVTAVVAGVSLAVSQTLVAEANAPTESKIVAVGHKFGSADLNVDTSGDFVGITSSSKNFTELGLIPGEWIYVGGDAAGSSFVNAANNGFKRVRAITANKITFDKSTLPMVNETGTGLTIEFYLGRVLKNEVGGLSVRKPVQFERTLGASDDAQPSQIQSDYVLGCVPNNLSLNINTADKITVDLDYIGLNSETRSGVVGVKSGTRPALVDSDAFNTSSDFARTKLSLISSTTEAPDPLFAFVTEVKLGINNNIKANKAIGVMGAFDLTAGTFEASGSLTAYFSDVAAIAAVANNSDITFDIIAAKANAGWVFDMPLLTLGDGKLNIAQDEPITIPLSLNAASASKLGADFDYTVMMQFFDYLPTNSEQ